MESDGERQRRRHEDDQADDDSGMQRKMYLRFAAMIATGMVVMYWVMFLGSYEWSHVRFSQSRVYMALAMGGTMGLVMFAWMFKMYRNTKANALVIVASLVLLGLGVFLDRSQAWVGDTRFMQAMIPHHSLAITRSERFSVEDVRVCKLAVAISEAQRREILEMDWLIGDIAENGVASTPAEARKRAVPQYDVEAGLECDPD